MFNNPDQIEGEKPGLNFSAGNGFYIYGEFDDTIMTNIVPALIKEIEYQKNLKESKIKFYINSNGGIADILFNLLSLIESAKKENIVVETYVFGKAYSCGSLLACAGTKGHRFIGEYAEHLCHLGSTSSGSITNPIESKRMQERIDSHFKDIKSIYKKYASIKNLDKVIENDRYFIRGDDIITNGLADKII